MYSLLPKVPLCTNIRTNPEMNIKTCLLYQLDKFDQIIVVLKIVLHNNKHKQKIGNLLNCMGRKQSLTKTEVEPL